METLDLRTHALTRGFMLGRPVKATPTPDGAAVLFLRAQPRVPRLSLYEFDAATGVTCELLSPEALLQGAEEHLSPEENARRERMRVSVGGFTEFQLSEDGTLLLLALAGKLYTLCRSDSRVRELATGAGTLLDPKLAPDGRRVAYVLDHDIHVLDLESGIETPITTGGSERVSHGLAEFVAQEEMGRFTGYWWSPDARSILYTEVDSSAVEVWHVADPAYPEQPVLASPYPRPGKANVSVRLGILPIDGGEPRWIAWDADRYPYLAAAQWERSAPPTLVVQTREQEELLLLAADPETGKTSLLCREQDPTWVNLHRGMPEWLEDGQQFLWISERDGGPSLELRSRSGDLVRVLVPPDAGLRGVVDADTESGHVIYRASPDPTQCQLFRVPIDGGLAVALTEAPGVHGATFGRGHGIHVHSFTGTERMPESVVRRADGNLIGELPSVAETPPLVPRVAITRLADEPGFYTAIVRPQEFREGTRYPVILDAYGGPLANVVEATMGAWILDQWLADQGFIVVSLDGRGTPGRGRDWERAIDGRFGTVPLEDQIAGLKCLGKRHPEMDLDRVGIVGWSFGGYLAAQAVLRAPEVFKAAVAGAPVTDFLDYDTHYTERYLGLPESNPRAYEEASLLKDAPHLRRPLLLIHGTGDDNVFFRHTLRLADALFRAGREFELLPLSASTHMTPDPIVREQLWLRIARFFRKHLAAKE